MLGLDEIGALVAVVIQNIGHEHSLAQHVAAARDVIIEAAHLAPPGDLAVEISPRAEFLAGISITAARGTGEDEEAINSLAKGAVSGGLERGGIFLPLVVLQSGKRFGGDDGLAIEVARRRGLLGGLVLLVFGPKSALPKFAHGNGGAA